MFDSVHRRPTDLARPIVLVSVRNAAEATAALVGGADVIDVKEPDNGALGRADRRTVLSVFDRVARHAPVTAAAGELNDLPPTRLADWLEANPAELVKVAFAGCGRLGWRSQLDELLACFDSPTRVVPTAYADWQAADAPPPGEVAAAAASLGCDWFLIDTFEKSAGEPANRSARQRLAGFVDAGQQLGLGIGIAGGLGVADVAWATRLGVDLIGFRGAACVGGRSGTVCAKRVRSLIDERNRLHEARFVSVPKKI